MTIFNEFIVQKNFQMQAMEKGDSFVYNQIIRNVADGTTLNFLMKNTETSETPEYKKKYIIITTLQVASEGKTIVENFKNVTIDTAGTSKDLNNENTGVVNNSIADLQESPTFSGGDSLGKQLIGANAGPTKVGGADGGGFSAFIVHPGSGDDGNIAGKITNESGQSQDISIRVEWFEVPARLMHEQP